MRTPSCVAADAGMLPAVDTRQWEPLEKAIRQPRRMRRRNWSLVYMVGVDLAAIAFIAVTAPSLSVESVPALILWLALTTITEAWTVPTTTQGEISMSMTIHYATAILFGPCFAAITAGFGALLADGLLRRRGFGPTAFNAGVFALVNGITALTFQALADSSQLSLTSDALALIVAAVVHLVLNTVLVIVLVMLWGQRFDRRWVLPPGEAGLIYLAMIPLGIMLAFAYQRSAWNLLYFVPVTLAIYMGLKLYVHLRAETDNALIVLADTIDKRDSHTFRHSVRVAEYVAHMAERLDLSAYDKQEILSAARVHDLGKLSVHDQILFKDGQLTPEERRQINSHPADGARLAGQFSMYAAGCGYIRHHHERWDGSGYPDGLSGHAIPYGARIIAVADAFDAMTSDRPYRRALSQDVALEELRRGAGGQFDPQLVDVFIDVMADESLNLRALAAADHGIGELQAQADEAVALRTSQRQGPRQWTRRMRQLFGPVSYRPKSF